MRAAVSISDVRIHDLQSCVEHRNVLSGNVWQSSMLQVNFTLITPITPTEGFCRTVSHC